MQRDSLKSSRALPRIPAVFWIWKALGASSNDPKVFQLRSEKLWKVLFFGEIRIMRLTFLALGGRRNGGQEAGGRKRQIVQNITAQATDKGCTAYHVHVATQKIRIHKQTETNTQTSRLKRKKVKPNESTKVPTKKSCAKSS